MSIAAFKWLGRFCFGKSPGAKKDMDPESYDSNKKKDQDEYENN